MPEHDVNNLQYVYAYYIYICIYIYMCLYLYSFAVKDEAWKRLLKNWELEQNSKLVHTL